MEENKEMKEKAISEEIKDTEIFSFGYLINVILDYYCETSFDGSADPSEAWKKGTEHEEKNPTSVPSDIDDMIKKAFKSQLKKFIK